MDTIKIDEKFLSLFPLGLEDPEWIKFFEKHDIAKIEEIYNKDLSQKKIEEYIVNNEYEKICKIVLKLSRLSSVISVFEKIAFNNFINIKESNKEFATSFYHMMFDFNSHSFERMVFVLSKYKNDINHKKLNVAKWPIITFFLSQKYPDEFIIIKPSTIKAISKLLEYEIEYKTVPNYLSYKKMIDMIKKYRDNSMIFKNKNLKVAEAALHIITE